ncbi:Xaa-Pro aminopeptidase 2 [Halocaridina rubra]|uniref:Xaa-Pro aminopeptidase 2 n=1 Tax=Halocaridina rubra TaxID=373956 RepID=A0AAN8WKZ2_HALRR
MSAVEKVKDFRNQQKDFMGISFGTISAFGSNGAVTHYEPQRETNKQIDNTSLYLLDSGGQYKDGTTDVTRTMHYGDPTPYQIETYTRVLQGAIDLASLIFPEGTGDTDVDIVTRKHLYEVGLDYRHGTGHGIGMYLNVHEAPTQIRIYGGEEHKFEIGQFFSDEPGFYQDKDFGIRLETIIRVVEKKTPYQFDKKSLGFEAVTLVPFESNLINFTMLSSKQCRWLNDYHAQVREIVGNELLAQDRKRGYDWVMAKTHRLPCISDHFSYAPDSASASRGKQEVMPDKRSNCEDGDPFPSIRFDTSSRVERLRQEMINYRINAYIIPSSDEHQSGYVAKANKRREYITGFSGSAGLAVVTLDKQALWTDGRYFRQADDELDCNWLLMKERNEGVS